MANAQTVERKWYVVDADGMTLGRLASQVAAILRRADQLDLKTWPAEQAERLNIALMKGYMLLKSGRFDEAQLDQTLSELTQAMGE